MCYFCGRVYTPHRTFTISPASTRRLSSFFIAFGCPAIAATNSAVLLSLLQRFFVPLVATFNKIFRGIHSHIINKQVVDASVSTTFGLSMLVEYYRLVLYSLNYYLSKYHKNPVIRKNLCYKYRHLSMDNYTTNPLLMSRNCKLIIDGTSLPSFPMLSCGSMSINMVLHDLTHVFLSVPYFPLC